MSLTLGEKLRQAREARGLSISEVAEQTRISALYLESIENNDYRILPGGIFNKGFVKSYAKHVGIDEKEALQDYAELLSEQGTDVAEDPKTYRPEVLTDENSRRSLLPTLIFSFIIVGLIVWGVLAFLKYYNPSDPAIADANVNRNSNVNAVNNATPTPAPISTNEIKIDLKPLSEPVALSYWLDGKQTNKTLAANETLSVNPQQSARFRYYRGFTPDKFQMTVNGKIIPTPNPPAKGVGIEFEINKENIQQILQTGALSSPNPATAATPAAISTARPTPRVTPTARPTANAAIPAPAANTRTGANANARP